MNRSLSLLFITLCIILQACSSGDRFEIKCEISGLDDGRVEMIYFDGQLNAVSDHARDSRVTLTGHTTLPALVDVWDGDGRLLFSCIAVDGDRIKVKMNIDTPDSVIITGNEATELLYGFRMDHRRLVAEGPSEALDSAVERFILANPSSPASAVALMTLYDLNNNPVKADSLLNRLDASGRNLTSIRDFSRTLATAAATTAHDRVRPITFHIATDSIVEFIPAQHSYGLLAVSSTRRAAEPLKRILKDLRADFPARRLGIVETSVLSDSLTWRRSVEADTVKWHRTWLPGGLGHPSLSLLAIPSTPFFIAVDSVGHQLYRGTSIEEADSLLRSKL